MGVLKKTNPFLMREKIASASHQTFLLSFPLVQCRANKQ